MRRLPACTLILGLVAGAHFAAAQQQGTLNVVVEREGRPVPSARIALLSGGRGANFPVTGPTGESSGLVRVDEIVDEYSEVWVEECPNAPVQIFVAVSRVQPPKTPASDCLRHKAGFFIARGDGPWQITVDTALLTVRTVGPLPNIPSSSPDEQVSGESRVWAQSSFGAGVNFLPNIANSCAQVVAVEPDAACSATNRTLDLLANASVNWSILGGEGGFWRAGPTDLVANATLNGTPSRLVSSFQPLGFYGAGVVHLPVSQRISVTPKAGVTYWRVSLTQHQTVGSRAATSTSSTLTGFSPFLGASADIMLFNHFGVGADYIFQRLRKLPVLDQDNHMFFAHVLLRFGNR